MPKAIDWEELRIGYNRIYKTDYTTVKEMLIGLMYKIGSNVKISCNLGIDRCTLTKKMLEIGIYHQYTWGQGRYYPGPGVEIRKIKKEDLRQMTPKEIAYRIKTSPNYVYELLKKFDLKCKGR